MSRTTVAAILGVAVLGGCGGGSATIYDRDATASCLSSQAAVASISTSNNDLDYIAQAALGGGIYVKYPSGNDANVSFERTTSDANRTYSSYKATGAAVAGNISDLLNQKTNVVIAFSNTPTTGELAAITDCLASKDEVKAGAPPAAATTSAQTTTTAGSVAPATAPTATDKTAIVAAIEANAGGTVVRSHFVFSKVDPNWAVVGIFLKNDPQGGAALVHKTPAGWKALQTGSMLEDCQLRYPIRVELGINCLHLDAEKQPFQEQLVQTPSKNITCDLYEWSKPDRTLACAVDSTRTWTAHPLAPKVWTLSGAAPTKVMRQWTWATGKARTLPYGTTFRAGSYQCVSRFTGLTCKDTTSGHGFFLSRQAQTTF
jgi:hypothetical protein